MDIVYYIGGIMAGFALLALQGLAAWAIIEAGWFIYTKLTGREY